MPSHGTHVDDSRHTCGWVMSHTWMSHAKHVDESCHTYEGVSIHDVGSIETSDSGSWSPAVDPELCLTHMDESRHTFGWVAPNKWMSHVTHMKVSLYPECGVTWHSIPTCDMTLVPAYNMTQMTYLRTCNISHDVTWHIIPRQLITHTGMSVAKHVD